MGAQKVKIVSQAYNFAAYTHNLQFATFVNFIGEAVPVSTYLEPCVAPSEDESIMLSVTVQLMGAAPSELPPRQPYTWVFEDGPAEALATFWSTYRQKA